MLLPMPIVSPVVMPTKGKSFFYKVFQAFKRRKWKLIEPYAIFFPKLEMAIYVPAPFILDFASVPRLFWFILDPVGLLLIGSIYHDFGYTFGGLFIREKGEKNYSFVYMPRRELDSLLKSVTEEVNGMQGLAVVAKYVVRFGGLLTWRKHRKNNLSPLREYPQLGETFLQ